MSTVAVQSVGEMSEWSKQLTEIAQTALELCPDFPRIAARHEAWWNQSLADRPLFLGSANTCPGRPVLRRLELLEKSHQWLGAKQTDLKQLHRVGDTLPILRVDFGPLLLAGLFGGERRIGDNTSWTQAFIDEDWSNVPDWTFSQGHPLWGCLQEIIQKAAQTALGRFLVGTPDLGNPADILLALRGANGLCMDVVTRPEQIRQAADTMLPSWQRAYTYLYQETLNCGAGLVHWLGLWSHQPYDVPACDFNAMIGPQSFADVFLPALARQSDRVGRNVFHLDGPDAARHIDCLLDVPAIRAIQFTPGKGTPSALAWLDMLKQIQRKGRSLLINCPAGEVLSVCRQLQPEGLAVCIDESLRPDELDALYGCFLKMY